ncbi:MAG: hypothetical protein Q9P44_11945 [Anaerolineae bacterium]|nr:hypothetical protein [Anaerolineae bacterium]
MTIPQDKNTKKAESSADNRAMKIDVGHLSVTGHVVFAGRDGQVNVNTGGDVAQSNTTTLSIGGVETNRQAYDSLIASIRSAQQILDEVEIDPDEKEAAQRDMNDVEEQLTASQKPNAYILRRAANALYKLSPAIAGAVVSIFSEPLVGQIVAGLGGLALQFSDVLMNIKSSQTNK